MMKKNILHAGPVPELQSDIRSVVQAHDPDRYLISLFAPPDRQPHIWNLFAFNHEIAKTREVVTETRIGLIRLQWWRESIGTIYEGGQTPDHFVLRGLAETIERFDLPREDFNTLIYAREFDLENVLPANMDGFLNYADYTGAPLLRLAVKIAGGDPEYEPTRPIALNYAIAGLLKSARFHATQRRCYLPEDLLKKNGVTLTQLYDFLKPGPGIKDSARAVSDYFLWNIKAKAPVLRCAQAIALMHMNAIKNLEYDLFDQKLEKPIHFKSLRAWLSVISPLG